MPATVRLSENTAGRGCTPHSDPAQIAPFCPGPPRCDPRGACHTPPPTVGLFCFPPAPPSFSSHGRALWASPLGNHCQVLPSPRGLGSHPTPPPARLLFPAALPGGMIRSARGLALSLWTRRRRATLPSCAGPARQLSTHPGQVQPPGSLPGRPSAQFSARMPPLPDGGSGPFQPEALAALTLPAPDGAQGPGGEWDAHSLKGRASPLTVGGPGHSAAAAGRRFGIRSACQLWSDRVLQGRLPVSLGTAPPIRNEILFIFSVPLFTLYMILTQPLLSHSTPTHR